MKAYLELLKDILDNGHDHEDRTGTGRKSVFSRQIRFNMKDGFPMVTTRKVKPEVFIAENLFFLSGRTNIAFLNERDVKIWDNWAVNPMTFKNYVNKMLDRGIVNKDEVRMLLETVPTNLIGEIGPMYGNMWRMWPLASPSGQDFSIRKENMLRTFEELPSDMLAVAKEVFDGLEVEERQGMDYETFALVFYYSSIDQINELIWELKKNPYSSRLMVTALNPQFTPTPGFTPDENVLLGKGALMPCHFAFQCFVKPPLEEGGKLRLSLKWHQRSVDTPVGLIQNIAGYALILHLLAHCCDMEADELVFDGGDVHVYLDQIEDVKRQLERDPMPLPKLWLNPEKKDIFAFSMNDIKILNYTVHPNDAKDPIKYKVSV